MYIENATWKSFSDLGTQPAVGDDVYALCDADNRWYRGLVEDTTRVSQLASSIYCDTQPGVV